MREEKRRRGFSLRSESDVWHRRESSSEDEVWVVFGAELDCGKLWWRRSLGAGVYQPEDSWKVREEKRRRRSLGAGVYQPEDSWGVREWLREEKRRRRFLEDFYCSRLWKAVVEEIAGSRCDACVVRERLREEKRRRGFLLRSESDVGAERAALRTKFGSFLARN